MLVSKPLNSENSQYRFSDLVDVPAFSQLLEKFFLATGIPNGVVEANGELLSMSSGANVCALFHRAHPIAAERCRESNLAIIRDLREGSVVGGLCGHGLMDYATPVVIEGKPMATIFLGQVLHAPPDMAVFRAQAKEFGFDEETYLAAIRTIPVVDEARLKSLMAVMVEMAKMLAACGLSAIRQSALKQEISTHIEREIQLEDILDFSPVAIGWSEGETRIEYINREFTKLFGYTLEDLPDLDTWQQKAYPDTDYRETVVRPWQKAVYDARQNGNPAPELEANVTCKDGTVRRVVIRATWVGRRRLVGFTDITERWVGEQRGHAHDAMLEMVARGVALENILDAIVREVESEDKTALCSILLLDAAGKHLRTGAAPNLPAFYSQAIDGIEIGVGVGSCGTAAALGQRVLVEDIQIHEYWQPYRQLAQAAGLRACWSEPIISADGKVLGTFAIYHREPKRTLLSDLERISFAANLASIAIENRRAHDELAHRAYFDYLTGLANRRYFMEQAENELARTLRYGRPLSVLMFDIDHFKEANDKHGHKVGDLVLEKLSEVSLASLRNIDVVGRIGGEEFAVLLPETEQEQAKDVAERLRAAIAATSIMAGELTISLTASFGVTTLCGKNMNFDTLLNQADQALYNAKGDGRDRVCVYQHDVAPPRPSAF